MEKLGGKRLVKFKLFPYRFDLGLGDHSRLPHHQVDGIPRGEAHEGEDHDGHPQQQNAGGKLESVQHRSHLPCKMVAARFPASLYPDAEACVPGPPGRCLGPQQGVGPDEVEERLPYRSARARFPGPGVQAELGGGAAGQRLDLSGKRVVCVITGSGLKDPDNAMKDAPAITELPADLALVAKTLGLT